MNYSDWNVSTAALIDGMYTESASLNPSSSQAVILVSRFYGSIVKNFLVNAAKEVFNANETVRNNEIAYYITGKANEYETNKVLKVIDYFATLY